MNAWQEVPAIRSLLQDERLRQILEFIMGKEVGLFQSINFEYGSEQAVHSDSIHMTR